MPQKRSGPLNAFWLKIIMVVLMTLDHLYYNLFPETLLWGHIAARTVAPVFCYLVTEGMIYTRDRRKYILRMFAFAAAMYAGNVLIQQLTGEWIRNSIVMSLTIAAAVIACADRAVDARGGAKTLWILAVIALFYASLRFEGQYMMPLMAVIFYYLRRRPAMMWALYFAVFCLPYLLLIPTTGRLAYQFWMILAIIPISLYNGERGPGGVVAKYFFYIYYPLHIWVIFLIERAVK